MKLNVRHFAEMKEQAGRECQSLQFEQQPDLRELYELLRTRHGFRFPPERLRVVVNGRLVDWDTPLGDADEVSFLPPFSGG
jgi:molybdopterin converting factor small subunit